MSDNEDIRDYNDDTSEQERMSQKKMADKIIRLMKKERPDYLYMKKVFEHVRKGLDLKGSAPSSKKLPILLTDAEMKAFLKAVWDGGNRHHLVMIKVLIFTGIRNAELASIRLDDVNLDEATIRIEMGKGGKDRIVPIPRRFRGELAQYVEVQRTSRAVYLFETNRLAKFSTRWIRGVVTRYAEAAGIEKRIYPHLFRHQLMTHLAKKGIQDSHLQVISGHDTRQSLEIYQSLSLSDVADGYQDAMEGYPAE